VSVVCLVVIFSTPLSNFLKRPVFEKDKKNYYYNILNTENMTGMQLYFILFNRGGE